MAKRSSDSVVNPGTHLTVPLPFTRATVAQVNGLLAYDPLVPTVIRQSLLPEEPWHLRRSEAISLTGPASMNRLVNLELNMPRKERAIPYSWLLSAPLHGNDQVVLPLDVMKKGPLTAFDIRDDKGNKLPSLLAAENGMLATVFLASLASERCSSSIVDETLLTDTLDVVFGDGGAEQGKGRLADFKLKYGSESDSDSIGLVVSHFADLFFSNFVLFAVVTHLGPTRRVLSFTHRDSTDLEDAQLFKRFAGATIGAGTAAFSGIRLEGAQEAASFHAEIALPDSVWVRNCSVADEDSQQEAWAAAEGSIIHIMIPGAGRVAHFKLSFETQLVYKFGEPLASALSVAILMLSSLVFLFSPENILLRSGSAAVPIFLVIPAGAALFLGDKRELHVLGKLLQPFRWIGVFSVLALIVNSLALVFLGFAILRLVATLSLILALLESSVVIKWWLRSKPTPTK